MKAFLSLSIALFLLPACVTSEANHSPVKQIAPTVMQDTAYLAAYEAASQSAEIYANFETLMQIRVTYLSAAFMKAYERRESALQLAPFRAFIDLNQKVGFLVSLFTPNDTADRFADDKYWNMSLQVGGVLYKRTLTLPQREKMRLQGFFPHISPWSREFLVLFVPEAPGATSQASSAPMRVSVHHPQAGVVLTWVHDAQP